MICLYGAHTSRMEYTISQTNRLDIHDYGCVDLDDWSLPWAVSPVQLMGYHPCAAESHS